MGITNIFVALSSVIFLPILTKNLIIQDYGVYVQIMVTISLLPAFAMLGLPFAMIRFLASLQDKKKIQESFYSIFLTVFITSSIIATLFYLFSDPLSKALFNGEIAVAKIVAVIIIFTCLNSIFLSYFRTFEKIKIFSFFTLIQTYLSLILISYLVVSGYGIFGVAIGILIAQVLIFLMMFFIIIYEIGLAVPKFKNLYEKLAFSLPTIPGSLSYWIVDSSDRYLISILLGTMFVGYYSPAYTLGNLIQMFLYPFSILLLPLLTKHYDNKEVDKVEIFLQHSLKFFIFLAVPSVIGISVLSEQILTILTTPDIASNGFLITPFIALSALFFGIYGILSQILVLKNKTKIIGSIWFIASLFNVFLNIIIIPYFGILGAAITTLMSYVIALVLTVFYSNKFMKIYFDFKFLFKCIFTSSLLALILFLIKPQELISMLIAVIICFLIYITMMFLLKGIKKEELKLIRTIIK